MQKKLRKRSLEGSIQLDGKKLDRRLLSEPLWPSEHGYRGHCISASRSGGNNRELVLEHPFLKRPEDGVLQLPQRLKISVKTIEAGVRSALIADGSPNRAEKAFVHLVTPATDHERARVLAQLPR